MVNARRGGVVLGLGWALCLGVVTAPGCGGPSASSVCELVCDCTGCSQSERDDCVDSVEDAESAAAKEGCEDAYDAFVSCVDERLDCDDDAVDISDCDDEYDDLADCVGADDLPLVGACESLKAQCKDCGESRALCEQAVDLVEELGGEEACQQSLDAGGITCADGGGGAPGGPGQ